MCHLLNLVCGNEIYPQINKMKGARKLAYKKDYDADFSVLDKLLKVKVTNSDFVLVPAEFNRLCGGDASSAIVLARIYYWWRAGEKGTKLQRTVEATGELCIAKSAMAMSLETGLDSRSIEQGAYKKLKKWGIITTYTKERENGHPTTKIVLNEKLLVEKFWTAYKELQIEKAQYKLKLYAKKLHKVRFYTERIEALQSPSFDPIKDFTRVQNDDKYNPNIDVFEEADEEQDAKIVKFPRKEINKATAESASSTEAESSILRGRTLEEFLAEKAQNKNTPKSVTSTNESVPKRKRKIVK